jgi:hypothetical protein
MARRQTKTHTRTSRASTSRATASRTLATAARVGTEAVDELETMRDSAARVSEAVRSRVEQGMAAGSQQFVVLGEQAFDSWMRSSNETLQRVVALNAELANWGRAQLDDSLTAVQSLSQCRSFGDAYGIQLGLMRSSMENSLRHANRVFSLTAHLMSTGAQAARQSQLND